MFDADRQIRFLYPPVFFVGSVLWAYHLDPAKHLKNILEASPWQPMPEAWPGLIIAIAGASGILVFSGFIIGSISVFILRMATIGGRSYEAFLSDQSFNRISKHLQIPRTKRDTLYLAATFDHELISEGIHRWLLRRWSMFYVCANSAIGLGLGWLFVWYFGFAVPLVWWIVTAVGVVMLTVLAIFNWTDTMRMLDFQSRRFQPRVFE